ncbi:hypothetical protein ATANTOWER_031959 [Ataeniobius toweri]|uniref:Uncharacterized protein n=1 Tax=Ataeniobius toweri TaxID=208326 RepID=A0ABU7B4V0_9TELE|nr:hypothetical protein [Ataeniobius toweri]
MPPEAALIKADFPHGLEKKVGTTLHAFLRARPDGESNPPHRCHSRSRTCLCHTVRPGQLKPFPMATEVSCKLTLCLPTRGCFPQRPRQLLLSTVHVRGSVLAEKISLEITRNVPWYFKGTCLILVISYKLLLLAPTTNG